MKNLFFILLISVISCKNKTNDKEEQKFNRSKWVIKEGKNYLYRDKMLNDVVYNIKLKGFRKDSVLQLLGQPDRTDTNYFFYIIDQHFFGDVPVPISTKSLVIKFINDTVEWRKIKE